MADLATAIHTRGSRPLMGWESGPAHIFGHMKAMEHSPG